MVLSRFIRGIGRYLGFENTTFEPLPHSPHTGLVEDEQNLEFFNSLSAALRIELSEEMRPIGNLENKAANPDAEIHSVTLNPEVFEKRKGEFRELSQEELDYVVFRGTLIRLCGESGEVIGHEAPNGAYFSVQDLLLAVAETERRTRGNTEWFGGIDVQHCFFEGMRCNQEWIWHISWGS